MLSLKASLNFNEMMYINYSDNRGTRASLLKPAVGREEAEKRLKTAQAVLEKGRPGTLILCGLDPAKPVKRSAR
jgi:tRNA A37 methylthiotransferase MiaB